jgi:hypothetical protein
MTSDQENLNALLRSCPAVILDKHVAITTYDSGVLRLTEPDVRAGWQSRNGIAYGPQILTLVDLPECARLEPADLYQEWYIFEAPTELGTIVSGNVLVTRPARGEVVAFVNYSQMGYLLDSGDPKMLYSSRWRIIRGI